MAGEQKKSAVSGDDSVAELEAIQTQLAQLAARGVAGLQPAIGEIQDAIIGLAPPERLAQILDAEHAAAGGELA